MDFIDLTHTFTDSMPVYPGDPRPKLGQVAGFAAEGFVNYELTTSTHVGTHMDAPLHMIENGKFVSDVELSHLFGKGRLIDASTCKQTIGTEVLEGVTLGEGDMVIVYTGWSKYFRHGDYFKDFPEFTTELAEALVRARVGAVGMDTPSPDRAPYLVHKILLSAGIPVVENLTNLKHLLEKKFDVVALPMKLRADGAPCRVVAMIK